MMLLLLLIHNALAASRVATTTEARSVRVPETIFTLLHAFVGPAVGSANSCQRIMHYLGCVVQVAAEVAASAADALQHHD